MDRSRLRRARLTVEALETRCCPSSNVVGPGEDPPDPGEVIVNEPAVDPVDLSLDAGELSRLFGQQMSDDDWAVLLAEMTAAVNTSLAELEALPPLPEDEAPLPDTFGEELFQIAEQGTIAFLAEAPTDAQILANAAAFFAQRSQRLLQLEALHIQRIQERHDATIRGAPALEWQLRHLAVSEIAGRTERASIDLGALQRIVSVIPVRGVARPPDAVLVEDLKSLALQKARETNALIAPTKTAIRDWLNMPEATREQRIAKFEAGLTVQHLVGRANLAHEFAERIRPIFSTNP